MGSIINKKNTPFTIKKRNVQGGIYETINTEFTGGVEIGNYHLDNYAGLDTAVLQSPITDLWVGGHTHRHVPLNTGNDNATNRPEAWHIQFDNINDPWNPTITFHSYDYLNSPGAFFTREEYVKRPINIKNIRQNSLGNFKHNYEVIQTSGRRISNNLIVDGFVAGGVLTTQFITGSHNYSLPVLDSITGSKSVIVERFNAPGSKEESSRGALDREGEEMSPNISLPWRNYKIRKPFYNQLSQSTPQFGTSLHGVYRNTLPGSGSRNDENDNGFITRPIPRTDIHYSWITASSTTTAGELGGYQSTYYGESDIAFISGSEIIVDSTKYIIDNLGISSLIKDKKQVDLDSKLLSYSSDVGLSASFGEITRTPYSFTTWTSIRTGEHPISRGLRKNNIISIQQRLKPEDIKTAKLPYDGVEYNNFRKTKRSSTSLNFTEPAVTFKYKPLKTRVRLTDAPEGSEQVVVHTFTNNIGNFANKDLRIETGLEEQERSEQFYDFLKQTYDEAGATGNPIAEFLGYQYSEVVWPREENTGLSKTRKREAYILDQPGFDRDGYDRQLGTQRVIWRDNQEDRRRSNNSEGGYYSSMNYLSTEETGSNFVQYEEGILGDNTIVQNDFELIKNANIDQGFLNSIFPLEKLSTVSELSIFKGSINQIYNDKFFNYSKLNTINSRTNKIKISGEFNNIYNEFYEEVYGESFLYKKSIGSLYINTSYKSLLTSLPKSRNLLNENINKIQDEEIFINPKIKYVSFVGGVELYTGSFVQNQSNFSNQTSIKIGYPNASTDGIFDLKVDEELSVYIVGDFTLIGEDSFQNVAKFNRTLNSWQSIGNPGFLPLSIVLSGSDVYVGGVSYFKKWDDPSWTTKSHPGNTIRDMVVYGGEIYAATDGGLKKYNSSANTWANVGLLPSHRYQTLKVQNDILYIGGYTTATTTGTVRTWNGTSTGNLGNPGATVYAIAFSGSDLYVAGDANSNGTAYVKKYLGSSAWSTSIGGLNDRYNSKIRSLQVSENDLYISGYIDISSSVVGVYDLYNLSWKNIINVSRNKVNKTFLTGSSLYYVGKFDIPFRNIGIFDLNKNGNYYLSGDPFVFSNNYFEQNLDKQDFIFSTIDKGLLSEKVNLSAKKPFFDSYQEFVKEIGQSTKDYSIIPEFNVSNNIENYIKNNNFRDQNITFIEIDGISGSHNSTIERVSENNKLFVKNYLTSDIAKNALEISKDNSEISSLEKINLKIDCFKKLLPYNGFYPENRTVQLSNLYKNYIDNNLHGGIYNLYYENKTIDQFAVDTGETGQISSISVAKLDGTYYMAVSNPTADSLKIYSTQDLENWNESHIHEYSASYVSYETNAFGKKIHLLSASNGLNLFVQSSKFVYNYSVYGEAGFLLQATSSDGTSWSELNMMQVSGTVSTYISGTDSGNPTATDVTNRFAWYFDVNYSNTNQEKIVFSIGDFGADSNGNDAGSVYVVTGTLVNNLWEWSNKQQVMTGSGAQNKIGHGVSVISCSSGYQMFASEMFGDSPISNAGNIWVVTSSDATTWSSQTIIASGTVTSSIGYNDIKAVDFNNKTYVFFSEPNLNKDGSQDLSYPYEDSSGVVYLISSSENNQWPTTTTYSDKTLIYTTDILADNALYRPDSESLPYFFKGNHAIDAKVVNDTLYYSFSNYVSASIGDFEKFPGELVIGKTFDGINWETSENKDLYLKPGSNSTFGSVAAFNTIHSFVDKVDGKEFLYNFSDVADLQDNTFKIFELGFTSMVNFSLSVSNKEKYYNYAALEPFMAPGILYNTIKSGIAVDWPCATGSSTAIIPYSVSGDTIVNAYYPKSFEMAGYNGSSIYESSYGHLRSNIEYRIPFENLIFPGEAFPVKDYLQDDLVRKTALTTLPDTDPLVQFLNGTYIYGGYEPYISPVDFTDINSLGPKRFSVPFVYRKAGSQDSGLYTLAMSNFLAEIVRFFLRDEKMTTFVSDPDYKWKEFNSSKTYYMDIVLEKTPDLVMLEAYHSDLHPTGSNGEKMNGRYFGYPINKTDKEIWGDTDFTAEEKKLIHNDPAYAPYTPPYFEGVARARISFKPLVSGKFTLQEIFENAKVENIFVDIAKGATTGSDAYVNAMPINSSIDIFGSAQAVEVTIDETTGQQTVRELQDSQNWIISPRMETPVLDFSSQELTPYENNYSKTGGFGRGMWSGYGSVPVNGKGIKIRLEDPFATKSSPNTGSLLSQIGLKPEERNVGSLADTKLISEAVVVIPYLDQTTRNTEYSTSRKNKTGFEFIKISKKLFNKQLSNYKQGKPAISPGDIQNIVLDGAVQETSITEMIEKMERYVIPPEMNFLEYKDIDPFVMYIAEFEHVLDKDDLKDIWQGLMPKISYTAETDSVTVSHNSAPYELFEGKEIPENLRWMVFKVKRKAEYNYFNVTATTKDDSRFNFNKIIGRKEGTDVYSYNWPYDFFSLVEFAKVELQLDYKKKEE